MILVEASWEEKDGAERWERAQMVNRSVGGACIRVKRAIAVGTRIKVQWRFEQFAGTTRYCRSEGREYLVGIQRNTAESTSSKKVNVPGVAAVECALAAAAVVGQRDGSKKGEASVTAAVLRPVVCEEHRPKPVEIPEAKRDVESVRSLASVDAAEGLRVRAVDLVAAREDIPCIAWPQVGKTLRRTEHQSKQPQKEKEARKERKPMRSKWFELGHKEEPGELEENGKGKGEVEKRVVAAAPAKEVVGAEVGERGDGDVPLELMSMEDIYRTAESLSSEYNV
jgi:hypothetical protein